MILRLILEHCRRSHTIDHISFIGSDHVEVDFNAAYDSEYREFCPPPLQSIPIYIRQIPAGVREYLEVAETAFRIRKFGTLVDLSEM